MTIILRLINDDNKESGLSIASSRFKHGKQSTEIYEIDPNRFHSIPTSPFAYWVGDRVIDAFIQCKKLEDEGRRVERGLFTGDDARFLRCYWEIPGDWIADERWGLLSKGGAYSPFYFDVYLCVKSADGFSEIHESIIKKYEYLNGNSDWVLHPECSYKRAGLTYPLRTTSDFSARVLPAGCFWTNKGISIFESNSAEVDSESLFFMLGVVNSRLFREFLSLRMGAAHAAARSYEEGIVASMPWPPASGTDIKQKIGSLARTYWQMGRQRDSISEVSHAFALPAVLRSRFTEYDPTLIDAEMVRIQDQIDSAVFELYGFSEADQTMSLQCGGEQAHEDDADDEDAEAAEIEAPPVDALLSWAVGVAFSRFDWRLATGERAAPSEPEPFDPLPAKSPGMLPGGAEPFHTHAGILVDDQGHPHDLARLVEEVLNRVDVSVPDDVRRWLRKDFFAFHLQRYSKSRRKAPIYWPLTTASGSYTLWVYYPSLNNQTLFTAVNDFLDGPNGKLTQISRECAELRIKGSGRSRDEEKQYETLQTFEQELTDLRDTLLKIAPTYQPNHDDGVQISAAPLWQLFRHKPWQKVLKDTWTKLEKGDYDWAHLAMAYWPERVREKCKADKSLAIAHGFEFLYVEPEAAPKKTRGKKKEQ